MNKMIMTVAPCIPPYIAKNIPELDLSPEGIASEVVRAYNAGANVVHLHVWDEKGQPTTNLDAFRRTLNLIRERCDIVIEGSTGGVNGLSASARSVSLQTDIELASLNPGSVNYDTGVYINSPSDIVYWAKTMHACHIKPDMVIFEAGMIANCLSLAEQGWITPPYLFAFVLGQTGALPATPKNLLFLSESLPQQSHWTAIGHGGHDLQMAVLAMVMGGHVRAGYEDNPYVQPGELAVSNAQLIERLVRVGRELGREVATPDEVRAFMK
ncbi:MAG: 3-keto-5-aminohexanoate cleavage protein [Anaerolineales bacterium]|nr:MAG: 3-keto-5-aminohexanoate cleavage protein [Anaerolineales bacterium]